MRARFAMMFAWKAPVAYSCVCTEGGDGTRWMGGVAGRCMEADDGRGGRDDDGGRRIIGVCGRS